jgi:hypothetical protein
MNVDSFLTMAKDQKITAKFRKIGVDIVSVARFAGFVSG